MSNKNYMHQTALAAKDIYSKVIELRCSHNNEVYSLQEMMENKTINCAAAMSIALQQAGCLDTGVVVSHTKACGLNGRKLKERKPCIEDCMTNHDKLRHCEILRFDVLYADLPAKYKQPGVCYIYDSNCAISAGDGYIYSCNNGLFQLDLKKQYRKNKMKRGYCFTHNILYCIIPTNH